MLLRRGTDSTKESEKREDFASHLLTVEADVKYARSISKQPNLGTPYPGKGNFQSVWQWFRSTDAAAREDGVRSLTYHPFSDAMVLCLTV